MAPKLAMVDVDGTLAFEGAWLPGALDLLAALQRAHVRVALCSGRPTGSLRVLADRLGGIDLVAGNSGSAALVRDGDEWRPLGVRPLPADVVADVWRFGQAAGIETWAYTVDEWLVSRMTPAAEKERWIVEQEPVVTEVIGRVDVGKVLLITPGPEELEAVRDYQARTGATIVMSGPAFADLVTPEATRDKGGELILGHIDLAWDDVLAIGDGENDLGMLSAARYAIPLGGLALEDLSGSAEGRRRVKAADAVEALGLLPDLLVD